MRNTPVPAEGVISNTPVAAFGTLFPNGIQPVSKRVMLEGVSSRCVAVTISLTRNIRVSLQGVSSAARANLVSHS